MSFGENLQYLRRQANMTQEDLAAEMNVSRQTVSKWESDGAYPEMEKLLQLCTRFDIDLDTLLRGSAAEARAADGQDYDGHMNRFTRQIMAGVALILAGVTMLLILCGFGVPEGLATVVFFLFLIAGVSILIVAGISHDTYEKENPVIQFTYDPETVREFRRRFPILIVVPTAMILMGVTVLVAFYTIPGLLPSIAEEALDFLGGAFLLLMVTLAVPIYIYAGIQEEKYDIARWNRDHDRHPATPEGKRARKASNICGAIMSCAAMVYLLIGFVWSLWHPGWLIFPVCGVICGIVNRACGVED